MGLTQVNIHSHLRGKGAQGRQGTAGQNDAANTLILQVLHAEARRETPITQNVSWKTQMNKHIRVKANKGYLLQKLKTAVVSLTADWLHISNKNKNKQKKRNAG